MEHMHYIVMKIVLLVYERFTPSLGALGLKCSRLGLFLGQPANDTKALRITCEA
jgi:hypothetical protein